MNAVNNRTLATEFVATALLLVTVVGTGVRVGTVSNESSVQLIVAVIAIMLIGSLIWRVANQFAPTHMNPLITLGLMARRKIEIALGTEHIAAQVSGAIFGVVSGNILFGLEAFSPDDQVLVAPNRYVGEFLVSLGVVAITLFLHENKRLYMLGAAIPLWLVFGSALTASPSFGNPAMSVANSISHTITSEPTSALPGLLSAQLLGGIAAYGVVWFFRFRHED